MARVVMVNTVLSGSHGRIMRDIAERAREMGHETILAFGRGPDAGEGTVRIGSRRDVLTHVALTRLLDRHARGSRGATRQFVKELEATRPDLLHLHNVHGYYLHGETLFDYIRGNHIPVIWTHHDCWALTGHCSHFARADCLRWQTGCHDCPLKGEYPASYGLDASRENWRWKRAAFASVPSLRIVTPSRWLSEVIGESYLADVPRQTIPNGVDLELFTPGGDGAEARAALGIKPGRRLLLAVASPFDARKGFADALAVARRLADTTHVCLVGLTDKQAQGLPPNVTGMARTDGPEALVSLYRAADCLINPTYEDTYPTVNMEAMACGTPVASYRTGGAAEQMDGHCGIAVDAGQADALAQAAMALADRREALRDACREYARARFDRQSALETYIGLYQTMLGV